MVPFSALELDMDFTRMGKILPEFIRPTDRNLLLSLVLFLAGF
jgi:hypothetical protein